MLSEATRAALASPVQGIDGPRTGSPPFTPCAVISHWLRACSGAIQLQQVVREADQAPLRADVREPTERKTSEAAPVFDVREDGLDDGLAAPVDGGAEWGAQLGPHLLA